MSIERIDHDRNSGQANIAELLIERQRAAGSVVDYLAQTDALFHDDPDLRANYSQMQRLASVYGTSMLPGYPINREKAIGFLQGAVLAAPIGLEYDFLDFQSKWPNRLYKLLSRVQISLHKKAMAAQDVLYNRENKEYGDSLGIKFIPQHNFVTDPGDTASRMSALIDAVHEDADTQQVVIGDDDAYSTLIDAWALELSADERTQDAIKTGFATVIGVFLAEAHTRLEAYREQQILESLEKRTKFKVPKVWY